MGGWRLFVMGWCVVCDWCCCNDLYACMNGASPVRFVLSLFDLCAFQMNPVCIVYVVTYMTGVCLFVMAS